jgi:hypothetical protein
MTSPNQQITSINGVSGSSATRNDVTSFRALSQLINYFPRGLAKFFPKIEGIYVSSSKLKAITKQDLEQFPQLKEIWAHHLDIEKLDDDLFASNQKVLFIDFEQNKIKFIGEETFEPLKQLTGLYLNANQCINKGAENDVSKVREIINEAKISCRDETKSKCQKEITSLKAKVIALENETLRLTNQHELSESELKTLREENLQLKHQLKLSEGEVKLRNQPKVDDENYDACAENLQIALKDLNNQQTVEERTVEMKCKNETDDETCAAMNFKVKFSNSKVDEKVENENSEIVDKTKIKNVKIESQIILFLPTNLATIFPQITSLTVSSSGLIQIDGTAFDGMNNLTSLTLTRNNIREISSSTFANLGNLVNLDLSFNKLEKFEKNVLDSLKKIESLNLSSNKIFMLPNGSFAKLFNLKSIFLSNNLLIKLSIDLFALNHQIHVFHADDNKLQFIDRKIFKRMINAQIDLSKNSCIDMKFDHGDQKAFREFYAQLEISCEMEY